MTARALGQISPADWPSVEAFARQLSEFCRVHVTPDRVLTTRLEAGEIELRWQAQAALVHLTARDEAALQNLRDTLGFLLEAVSEGLAAGLFWQEGGGETGKLPPNFRLARVESTRQISPRFQRIRLFADDIGFLARTGLHFRLLLPRDPHLPDWPRLSDTGRTIWPDAGQLHMPVYTIRAIDAGMGWLDVDVFLHGQGPTCTWARRVQAGELVGITGPCGGWLPQSRQLCLGGDETALPVIARILETAAVDVGGVAVIEVGDISEIQSLAAPPGVEVQWLTRGNAHRLRDVFTGSAVRMISSTSGTAVMFGGEKSDALEIKANLRALGRVGNAQTSIAAYWIKNHNVVSRS